jgi:hypothetical protein
MIGNLLLCTVLLAPPNHFEADPSTHSLPKPEDIFTVAAYPHGKAFNPYFTPESLLRELPNFKAGRPELKVGAKRWWQTGVIVLKSKQVLFWRTCRRNFIIIETADGGSASYILGDGKDDS